MNRSPADQSNGKKELDQLRARIKELERTLTVGISQQKPGDTNLAETRLRLFGLAVEQINEGIVIGTFDGHLLFANRAMAAMHGYTPEEVIGMHYTSFFPSEQASKLKEYWDECQRCGISEREFIRKRKDGTLFPAHVNTCLFSDENGKPAGYIITIIDLTQSKQAEAEKQQLEIQLQEARKLESVAQMAGGVAHDFNNMLAVIVGNASILRNDPAMPGKVREAMSEILTAAERGSGMTRQLLEFCCGGIQRPTSINFNRLIESTVSELQLQAPDSINFALELDPVLPCAEADPPRIVEIIKHLGLNAIQASPPYGTITITTDSLMIGAREAANLQVKPGLFIRFRVQDEGCGIDPAILHKIFDPYVTTKPMGRGMGLPIASGFVRSHGGQIRAESRLGHGATFTVLLPAEQYIPIAPTTKSNFLQPPKPDRGSETILIIDDESTVIRTVERMLSSLGYCVVSHASAKEAKAFLANNAEDIDLVLCDLNMPECNGQEIAGWIKARYPYITIMLISGAEEPAPLKTDGASPVAGFIPKPFSLVPLSKAIRQALDSNSIGRRRES